MNFPVERFAAILLISYPVLLLTVKNGTSACFLVLIILAFYELVRTRGEFIADDWDATAVLYGAAMCSLTVATFVSQAAHFNWTLGPYDGTSRFLFAIPVFLLLRRLPQQNLTAVQYGFAGGALLTALIAVVFPHSEENRLGSYFLNVIHFGDLALMLGLMSAMTINWERFDSLPIVILKIAGLAAGLYASILSGSRGGWAAIPIVFFVWLSLTGRNQSRMMRSSIVLSFAAASIALYFLSDQFHNRIVQLVGDFGMLDRSDETSTGQRLQIWGAAFYLFTQYPIFGVGPDQFANMVPTLTAAGYLTPSAALMARAEVHNEILTRAATLGVFGLVSILLIYFVPLMLFVRAAYSPIRSVRMAGVMGACFVVGFFVFGLTVETFNLKTTATFYSLTVAVLLAVAANRPPHQLKVRNISG